MISKPAPVGWMVSKDRNNITFKSKVCDESGSVDQQAVYVWKDDVVQMINETPVTNIFNVGEN